MNYQKKKMFRWLTPVFFACTLMACNGGDSGNIKVAQLRCCDRVNPEGVDRALLSWKIESTRQANGFPLLRRLHTVAGCADTGQKG